MKFTDDVDRRAGLTRPQFEREYLSPPRPVILTDAIDHWPALGRWSPDFFRTQYGHLVVDVDGQQLPLRELIDGIEASTDERPAPYLRNQPLAQWPPELMADVSPMPECTRPNWLESRVFPSRERMSFAEVYIGGRGARFPVLHWDGLHTHAFLMQLHGEKEYIAFAPDQSRRLYPKDDGTSNLSEIEDVLAPDLDRFPLAADAQGVRFHLHAGETLFVPSGWWHTVRILSPSVTVSINAVDRANAHDFAHDYRASLARRSRFRSAVAGAALQVGTATHLFEYL